MASGRSDKNARLETERSGRRSRHHGRSGNATAARGGSACQGFQHEWRCHPCFTPRQRTSVPFCGNSTDRRLAPRKPPTPTRSASGRACFRFLGDRKSTRLNSSHLVISYAVFCLKKKKKNE